MKLATLNRDFSGTFVDQSDAAIARLFMGIRSGTGRNGRSSNNVNESGGTSK